MNETPWLEKITMFSFCWRESNWMGKHIMVSSLCQLLGVCTQATCYHNTPPINSWWCTFTAPAMMSLVRQITCHVNPEQIPVLTVDQPLYAIAKRTQWKWPDEYGEKCYSDRRSPHLDGYAKVIGIWLDGSGWSYVMTSANVTAEGRTAGLVKGAYISRVIGDIN